MAAPSVRSTEPGSTTSRTKGTILAPDSTSIRWRRIRPNPFWHQDFHGDHHDSLRGQSLRAFADRGVTAITNGQIALVDFDDALQALSPWTNHRPAKAMQNGPGGLVTAKAQHALQTQGTHPRFLARNMPCGSQPDLQGCACLIENRAGCDRTRMSAGSADQACAATPIRFTLCSTTRANESIWPA